MAATLGEVCAQNRTSRGELLRFRFDSKKVLLRLLNVSATADARRVRRRRLIGWPGGGRRDGRPEEFYLGVASCGHTW